MDPFNKIFIKNRKIALYHFLCFQYILLVLGAELKEYITNSKANYYSKEQMKNGYFSTQGLQHRSLELWVKMDPFNKIFINNRKIATQLLLCFRFILLVYFLPYFTHLHISMEKQPLFIYSFFWMAIGTLSPNGPWDSYNFYTSGKTCVLIFLDDVCCCYG